MDDKNTTTAIFVPKTDREVLAKMLQSKEDTIAEKSDWMVKILEKPGVPLQMHFYKKFKMFSGC